MAQRTQHERPLLSAWLLALSFCLPLYAQDVMVDEAVAVPGEQAEDDGIPAVAAGGMEIPREYRGAAMPLESAETASSLRRAEGHFGAGEWARGLALVDEVLERATSPSPTGIPAGRRTPAEEIGGPGLDGTAEEDLAEEPELEPGEELYALDGILYHPVPVAVRHRLLELPAEARDLARRTFEPPARAALDKARSLPLEESLPALRRVGERYPLTVSGGQAWVALAERYLGAARPAEAAAAFETRLELPFVTGAPNRATVLAQAAMCHLLAGAPLSAGRILETLVREHGEEIVPVRGEPVRAGAIGEHPFFRALLRRAEAATGAGQEDLEGEDFAWLCRRGSFDRAALPLGGDSLPELGSQARWIFDLVGEAARKSPNASQGAGHPGSGISWGDRVYFRRGTSLVALNAHTGKLAWRAAGSDSQVVSSTGSGLVLLSSAARNRTLGGDLSPVLIPASTPEGDALVVGLDGAGTAVPTSTGRMRFEGNGLVAYEARSGKLAWKAGGGEMAVGPLRGMVLTAPPVPAEGLLLVPALRGESACVVAFKRGGKLAWLRRLYSYSTAFYARYGGQLVTGAPLAASEDFVVTASGQGLMCGLRASTGELIWVTRYRSQIQRRQYITGQGDPPAIVGGRVIASPPDSDFIHALDLRTGEILWERRPGRRGARVPMLGVDSERVYVAADGGLKALALADGKDVWINDEIGYPNGSAVVAQGRLLVPIAGGLLALLDSSTGEAVSQLRLVDTRLGSPGHLHLFLARGEVLASTSKEVFCIRPQKEAWEELTSTDGGDPFQRIRLLRSEKRYTEALEVLERLLATSKSRAVLERAEKDLVSTARLAAEATGESVYIRDLLAREDPVVTEREEVLALRLLAASYLEAEALEDGGSKAREEAVRIYLDLCPLDGVFATSPDGFEVDVGAYASDSLWDLRRKGADFEDLEGEARARDYLVRTSPGAEAEGERAPESSPSAEEAVRGATSRALAQVVLRSAHLAIARLAEEELARRAQLRGDVQAAGELRALHASATRAQGDGSSDRIPFTSGGPELTARPVAGLKPLLDAAGEEKFGGSFWIAGEDDFLVATTADSLPLPGLLAIAGTSIHIYDENGDSSFSRELPYYPDVEEIKASLQAHVEEPALARLDEEGLLLFTPAGLYRFSDTGGTGDGGSWKPRGFRLEWVSRYPHPLLSHKTTTSRAIFLGGMRIPDTQNFFPELTFDALDRPVVLLPTGELFGVDIRTGKYVWHFSAGEGNAASSPRFDGRWMRVRTSAPAGIRLYPVPLPSDADAGGSRQGGLGGPGGGPEVEVTVPQRPRWIRSPDPQAAQAALAGGKLVTAFLGKTLEVSALETGRRLWGRKGVSTPLVSATGEALWFCEASGRLVSRSLRSGRTRFSLDLPEGGKVIDAYQEVPAATRAGAEQSPDSTTTPATVLLVSRHPSIALTTSRTYYGTTSTGSDLFLVRTGPDGTKLGELKLHSGAATYAGGCLLVEDGSVLVVFNGEMAPEKWYTRILRIDPHGKTSREILSVEVQGKGTGQPPRLAVLEGGLAVGNADGFGWFVPGDDPEGSPTEKSGNSSGQP